MKQRAEYERREERIQSVGRLGNPILLNFLAEEAAWTFIEKKLDLIWDSSCSVCGSVQICMNKRINRGVNSYSETAGERNGKERLSRSRKRVAIPS